MDSEYLISNIIFLLIASETGPFFKLKGNFSVKSKVKISINYIYIYMITKHYKMHNITSYSVQIVWKTFSFVVWTAIKS